MKSRSRPRILPRADSPIALEMELYNFDSNSWLLIHSATASRFTDSTINVQVQGNLNQLVEPGTNTMRARTKYTSSSPREGFSANIDQVYWSVR